MTQNYIRVDKTILTYVKNNFIFSYIASKGNSYDYLTEKKTKILLKHLDI